MTAEVAVVPTELEAKLVKVVAFKAVLVLFKVEVALVVVAVEVLMAQAVVAVVVIAAEVVTLKVVIFLQLQ